MLGNSGLPESSSGGQGGGLVCSCCVTGPHRKEGCQGDAEISIKNRGYMGLPFDAPFPDLLEDLESMPKDLALYMSYCCQTLLAGEFPDTS